ncbi:MAG: YdeI/OmpD-associated family protein [Acidobacteria bacterium]|nr:YdeI/OmpD-associated family protein [Acidobacteriota bacterium]
MADAPRDAMGHLGKITALSDLPTDRTLIGYVRKAARLNETGAKAPTRARAAVRTPLRIPDYFAAALDRNKAARATFERFSPSHKKEYVEWVTEAKRDETRQKRLNTAVEWMAEGKVRNWKYVRAR